MTTTAQSTARWLVIGNLGMLGTDVMGVLAERDVTGIDRPDIDITSAASVDAVVHGYDVVVNCAAYTAVDEAESHEGAAFLVNAVGPATVARACARTGARLVHISTDYVFAGDADVPYREDALPAPRSAYGRTKRGQPTWSADVAARLVEAVDLDIPAGTYHATSSGETTWFGLTRRIFELLGADPERVQPTTTDAFPRPAPRPAYSVLGHDRWADVELPPLRDWCDALDAAWPALTTER